MKWGGPAEFFAMGGYGLYVWGAYAVCLAAMLLESCWRSAMASAAFASGTG